MERAHGQQARRYRLGREEAAGPGLGRVVAGQLANAVEWLTADDAAAGDAVHDARKALKRSRAALRLGRDLVGDERYRRENAALRDAGRDLSELRDAQVLLETLDELAPPASFPRLRQALAAQAGSDQNNGRAGTEIKAVVPQLEQARDRVESWALPEEGRPGQLAPGFERIYRRGRRALRDARRDPSVENLHELRKRSKDLWYAAQLLRDANPKHAQALARRAHELSDLLGSDHDLAILGQRAGGDSGLLTAPERKRLEELIASRRKGLRGQAMDSAGRLYRHKPGKLIRRLALT
ncbi:MAG TPA: CHAD domain-containing protein [Solirubrobacteraceae bacterium]|nr:CHAD domain-containing protein [Solirubrobacteraceae bacterium]